jgi:2,3-bisphosphoglycerate-dependent phosphoglycerate mutase
MSKLILLRHGQSEWNLQNRFTGWVDVDLSEKGVEEAINAGKMLKGFKIDKLYTSVLKRAIRTAELALDEMGIKEIPTEKNQALNERHYGDLQGQNKAEIGEKYGQQQLKLWRRSFDIQPPNGESLKDTLDRVKPYYLEYIEPDLKKGLNILVAAHGNSLRALVMHLENISEKDILELNIPTGIPYVYDMDENCNIIKAEYLK